MPVSVTGVFETLQNAAAATGNGTAVDMTGVEAFTLSISGTFVGTVSFEGTIDDTNWFAVALSTFGATPAAVTSATAAGQWALFNNVALSQFRARISAYTSGNVTAQSRKDYD